MNLNWYCLRYVFVLFLDLLERVAEWFQQEELTFKHLLNLLNILVKEKEKKVFVS